MADNDRLEREIEEILGKIEQFPDQQSRMRRARQRKTNRVTNTIAGWQQGVARQVGRVSVSQIMLLSFLMILFAFFFRGRGLPAFLSSWILVAGVVLFVSAFAVLLLARGRTGGGGRTVEQRWRGRSIQYQAGPTLSDRVRRWWTARTRR
ncbi:MAG: hypothetical protein M0R73_09365 [Dehalococcoidia bacterium]|nr:hypothetical protein [Dehalococcoidia bacterium]